MESKAGSRFRRIQWTCELDDGMAASAGPNAKFKDFGGFAFLAVAMHAKNPIPSEFTRLERVDFRHITTRGGVTDAI